MKKKRRTRLNPTASSYYRDLNELLREMKRDVEREIIPIIERHAVTHDSWVDSIRNILERLRTKWTEQTGRFRAIASKFVNLNYNQTSNKIDVKIDTFGQSQRMVDYLKASVEQNVTLIKSIGSEYHDQVANIVLGNMRQGKRSSAIIKELSERYKVAERRARFIARDQTAKARGELNKVRQQDVGYEYFKWETSQDERVRDEHQTLADRDVGYGRGIYRWDDLPVVNGRALFPGSDYNCRCNARPIRRSQK